MSVTNMKKPIESVDLQMPNSIEWSDQSVEGEYTGGDFVKMKVRTRGVFEISSEEMSRVILEAEQRGERKAWEKMMALADTDFVPPLYSMESDFALGYLNAKYAMVLLASAGLNSLEEKKV